MKAVNTLKQIVDTLKINSHSPANSRYHRIRNKMLARRPLTVKSSLDTISSSVLEITREHSFSGFVLVNTFEYSG